MSSEPDVSRLITVNEAVRILDAVEVRPRMVKKPLTDAAGLRLAGDLVADRDYPPFAKSLMDGYAVRAADLKSPTPLKVVGEVAAGQEADRALEAGETMAIMTGAPLPPGADAVVPIEDVEQTEIDGPAIRVRRAPAGANRYIAPKGSDCPAGRLVLAKGTVLGPAQIAVAATVGASEVDVFEPPRVAVLATGDELVGVDQQPAGAQIRTSNSSMLIALLRRFGCEVVDLGLRRDDRDAIRGAIVEGARFDALLITGGMSVGRHDHVPSLLEELGASLQITKLRIKPGKPFLFGSMPKTELADQTCFVFGLPGNPVSAFVCTVRLVSRLLGRLAGGEPDERWVEGRLQSGLPANGPREFYQPVIRTPRPARVSAQAQLPFIKPLTWKGSADVFTLAQANALLVRGENEPAVPEGTLVRVLEIG